MGAVTAAEKMLAFAEQMRLEAEEKENMIEGLNRAIKYMRREMDRARDADRFKEARSDYRFCCALLGKDHD